MNYVEILEKTARRLIGVKPENPAYLFSLRRAFSHVRNMFVTPIWVNHPTNLQIGIHNYCNLWQGGGKGCIHCNVKPTSGWKLPRGRMPCEMFEFIVRYWSERGVLEVAPYINGEFCLDERAHWFSDVCQKYGLTVVIDTNGSLYDFRERLVHPNNVQVRFSYSALTPEVYEKVHGKDLFRDATATVKWFLKNREKTQYPMLYFITNRFNKHEVLPYIKRWLGKAHICLFPLHEVGDIQGASLLSKVHKKNFWSRLTHKVTGSFPKQPNRPINIYPNGTRRISHFQPWIACQGSTSFTVNWQGLMLHCTDIPYKYNYGSIYDRDMQEVWWERNIEKLTHPACKVCSVRSPQYYSITKMALRKMFKVKGAGSVD